LVLRSSGQFGAAAELHRRQAETERANGQSARVSLANLAVALLLQGRYPEARQAAEEARSEALAHGEEAHDTTPVTLAQLDLLEGQPGTASSRALAWYGAASEAGLEVSFRVFALYLYVVSECALKNAVNAREGLREALPIATRSKTDMREALCAGARLALLEGDLETAAKLVGGGLALTSEILMPDTGAIVTQVADAAGDRFGTLAEEGRRLTVPDLLRLAYTVAASGTTAAAP
jgi:hypothetical protein